MMALNCEGTLGLQIIWLIASSTVMLSGAGMWSWFSADVHEVSMFLPSLLSVFSMTSFPARY